MEQVNKIKKISAADQVYEQLKQFILDGHWTPGEKITTETELSRQLGVNRLTVRVALQRLAALGLLDIRVGDGTYVKEFDMQEKITELSPFYINDATMQDTGEYRRLLELSFLDMAVQRRTQEELDRFHRLCLDFQRDLHLYYSSPDKAFSEAAFLRTVDTSSSLHTLICEMTHNQQLIYAFTLCKEPLRRHMEFNASSRTSDIDESLCNIWEKRWFQLYDALRTQDAPLAHRLLEQIIN